MLRHDVEPDSARAACMSVYVSERNTTCTAEVFTEHVHFGRGDASVSSWTWEDASFPDIQDLLYNMADAAPRGRGGFGGRGRGRGRGPRRGGRKDEKEEWGE